MVLQLLGVEVHTSQSCWGWETLVLRLFLDGTFDLEVPQGKVKPFEMGYLLKTGGALIGIVPALILPLQAILGSDPVGHSR